MSRTIRRRSALQFGALTAVLSATGLARAAGIDAPVQLRIGFQKAAVNLVILKQQRALEQRYAGS